MRQTIAMEEARKIAISDIAVIDETEECSIYEAGGRVIGRQYVAGMNQPPFDRSPLDGFAFHHEDVEYADIEHPVTLRITQTLYAGDDYHVEIQKGEAARIMTGAGIPTGADCVIRQEDTVWDDKEVQIFQSMNAHDNICDAGEDVAKGSVLMERGEVVTSAYAAVLAGQGNFTLDCYRRLRVGVLATGSELTEETQIEPGQIYNSNVPMLSMRLQEFGMQTKNAYCSDQIPVICSQIEQLLQTQDVVITTGGVSVGEKDYLPVVMEKLGARILFHGIAMKPGTPMLAARLHHKMIFCLSGNPFAAMATLELIALPALLKASGRKRYYPVCRQAVLSGDFSKSSKKGRRFVRAYYEDGLAQVPDNHSSGSIASMIDCNCLLDISEGTGPLKKGDCVSGLLLLTDKNAVSVEDMPEGTVHTTPVVCISGRKNVGKTTVMEQLVKQLTQMGFRIGVIKHDGHDFIPDVPETDSYRAYQAGAEAVAVYSGKRMLYYQNRWNHLFQNEEATSKQILPDEEGTVQERLPEDMINMFRKNMGGKLDLILVEGLKNSHYPKIEVLRGAISNKMVAADPVLAICSDVEEEDIDGKNVDTPIFSFQEIKLLADMLTKSIIEKM